jgi:hypothetical protein
MDAIQEKLQPLIDLLPEKIRDYWWAVYGVAAILLVLLLFALFSGILRTLFGSRKTIEPDWARKLREDLSSYPPPPNPLGKRHLTIYNVPVRIRLVVLALAGKEADVEPAQAESFLNREIPGLGAIAAHDRPRVRVWPPQLSQQGFATAFFRHIQSPQKEGQPSPWVLVAGRSQSNQPPVLIGLALWADQPNSLGRIALEPHQWLDVLRVKES